MKSSLIKEIFLDFFKKKNHKILPSFPIILSNDPSLFFTNSGMNYFKDFFLGYKKPKYTRIANSQKCLRISGKHNDLETVGYDDYHHTMFEMLGNWSFGDYYKYDIISWAWDLLINKYNLSKKDIYITIFSGNIKKNIKKDNTSYKIWNNFVNKERILFFNKENFWNMGEEGLCGTSTEIHIDLRSEKEKREFPGKYLINKGNNNIIEIWNIVFIEFFKIKKHLKKLSKKYIDTGMGLERISRILQKKKSNYETDLFFPIIKQIENVFKIKYGKNLNKDVAIRIISDHIRSISFSISDGVIPSNNGHEYVIRRLIRRTISYSYRFLKKKKPIIYKIVDSLSEITKKNFPEINNNKDFIKEIIEKEEFLFLKTIQNGIKKIYFIINNCKKKKKKIINGKKIFKLYDTYGFPIDISNIIAKENNLKIDFYSFEEEMNKQKNISKNFIKKYEWNFVKKKYNPKFLGYYRSSCTIQILQYRIIKINNEKYYQLVFDKTPFFPNIYGQINDIGIIKNEYEKIDILNVKKENNIILHYTKKLPNNLKFKFNALVDYDRRNIIKKNHTSIHILYYLLKKILGKHIKKIGFYMFINYFYFDFYYNSKLNIEKILKIEKYFNKIIIEKKPIIEKIISIEKAKNYFKKYSFCNKEVKKDILTYTFCKNEEIIKIIKLNNIIKEFCLGINIDNTFNINNFKIISYYYISSCIIRIKATTN